MLGFKAMAVFQFFLYDLLINVFKKTQIRVRAGPGPVGQGGGGGMGPAPPVAPELHNLEQRMGAM